ncbi:MAG: hypothetical protein Q9226_000820 [Calogaya cf. arnoldii]
MKLPVLLRTVREDDLPDPPDGHPYKSAPEKPKKLKSIEVSEADNAKRVRWVHLSTPSIERFILCMHGPKEWKHEDAVTVKTRKDVMIAQSYDKIRIFVPRDGSLRIKVMFYYIPVMLSVEFGLPVEAKQAFSAALQLDEMRIARLPGAPAVSSLTELTTTNGYLIELPRIAAASKRSGNGG